MPKKTIYKVLGGPHKGMRCTTVERHGKVTLVRLSTGEHVEVNSGLLQRVRARFGFIYKGPHVGTWCVIVETTDKMLVVRFNGTLHKLPKDTVKPWRHGQPRPSNTTITKGSSIRTVSGGLPTLGSRK